MSASRRLMRVKTNPSDNEENEMTTNDILNGEYLAVGEDSTDDDGSITYIEDYNVNENGTESEEGGYFVEYVNEGDEGYQLIEENENENDNENEMENGDELAEDELYNCNLCGMNFKSITEHVERYHSDQDVIIDILDEDGTVVKQEGAVEYQDVDEENNLQSEEQDSAEEMIVYNDESMDEDNSLLDEYVLEDGSYEYNAVTASTSNERNNKLPSHTIATTSKSADDTYNCTYCSDVFTALHTFSRHLLSKHSDEITQPNGKKAVIRTTKVTKSEKPSTSRTIEAPKKMPDRGTQDHLCGICNTNFYSAKSLKLHARMHLPVKSKTIDETTEQDMDILPSNNQENQREKFYCPICGKHYDKTFEEVHVQMHNGEEKFNCPICNKVFPNVESYNMHKNAHQEGPRVIKTKAELANKKLPYGCQYCGKEFARPHEKVKHERVHTGEKPYECELCGKCFRVSYCLTIHMRTHTDARPYVCPHCNKRFKAQSVYNHHLLTHSDERNYKCPYCPKKFKTSVQLSGHKNSHTKPFTCTECNRPFGSLYAVRAHMESHKRTNHSLKHICDICGAKYARRFALNDHIKEQHKDVQVVQIVDTGIEKSTSAPAKKPQPKRQKKIQHYEIILAEEHEADVNDETILPNVVEQEITISQIEHFGNEEEVSHEINEWLKC